MQAFERMDPCRPLSHLACGAPANGSLHWRHCGWLQGEIAPQNTQLTTIHPWQWPHFCRPQRFCVPHCGHGIAVRCASAETAW